jgi:ElaB/YqjD/DUF883 family membrane-anchored ribosome-binding protein
MEENTTGTGSAGAGGGDEGGEGGRFGRAKQFVDEKYQAAAGAARNAYSSAREKVEDVDFGAVTDQVRTYVKSNPGKALLISVGVGFLIGLLLRRDDED